MQVAAGTCVVLGHVHGDRISSIGCGPVDALHYLPAVRYGGYDVSAECIGRARFGDRGTFFCKMFDEGDGEARRLFVLLREAVRPGGRVVCLDPCFAPGQNPLARLLIRNDRGCDVQDAAGYARLAEGLFESVNTRARHKAWIPYTHCYMVCS